MILDDIKSFIAASGLAQGVPINFDYDSTSGEDTILLKLYNASGTDLGRRSSVETTIKFSDLKLTRDTCFALHDLFFPEDTFQKAITVNGKTMHAKLNKGPAYLQKDSSNRHNYVLDITFTHNR